MNFSDIREDTVNTCLGMICHSEESLLVKALDLPMNNFSQPTKKSARHLGPWSQENYVVCSDYDCNDRVSEDKKDREEYEQRAEEISHANDEHCGDPNQQVPDLDEIPIESTQITTYGWKMVRKPRTTNRVGEYSSDRMPSSDSMWDESPPSDLKQYWNAEQAEVPDFIEDEDAMVHYEQFEDCQMSESVKLLDLSPDLKPANISLLSNEFYLAEKSVSPVVSSGTIVEGTASEDCLGRLLLMDDDVFSVGLLDVSHVTKPSPNMTSLKNLRDGVIPDGIRKDSQKSKDMPLLSARDISECAQVPDVIHRDSAESKDMPLLSARDISECPQVPDGIRKDSAESKDMPLLSARDISECAQVPDHQSNEIVESAHLPNKQYPSSGDVLLIVPESEQASMPNCYNAKDVQSPVGITKHKGLELPPKHKAELGNLTCNSVRQSIISRHHLSFTQPARLIQDPLELKGELVTVNDLLSGSELEPCTQFQACNEAVQTMSESLWEVTPYSPEIISSEDDSQSDELPLRIVKRAVSTTDSVSERAVEVTFANQSNGENNCRSLNENEDNSVRSTNECIAVVNGNDLSQECADSLQELSPTTGLFRQIIRMEPNCKVEILFDKNDPNLFEDAISDVENPDSEILQSGSSSAREEHSSLDDVETSSGADEYSRELSGDEGDARSARTDHANEGNKGDLLPVANSRIDAGLDENGSERPWTAVSKRDSPRHLCAEPDDDALLEYIDAGLDENGSERSGTAVSERDSPRHLCADLDDDTLLEYIDAGLDENGSERSGTAVSERDSPRHLCAEPDDDALLEYIDAAFDEHNEAARLEEVNTAVDEHNEAARLDEVNTAFDEHNEAARLEEVNTAVDEHNEAARLEEFNTAVDEHNEAARLEEVNTAVDEHNEAARLDEVNTAFDEHNEATRLEEVNTAVDEIRDRVPHFPQLMLSGSFDGSAEHEGERTTLCRSNDQDGLRPTPKGVVDASVGRTLEPCNETIPRCSDEGESCDSMQIIHAVESKRARYAQMKETSDAFAQTNVTGPVEVICPLNFRNVNSFGSSNAFGRGKHVTGLRKLKRSLEALNLDVPNVKKPKVVALSGMNPDQELNFAIDFVGLMNYNQSNQNALMDLCPNAAEAMPVKVEKKDAIIVSSASLTRRKEEFNLEEAEVIECNEECSLYFEDSDLPQNSRFEGNPLDLPVGQETTESKGTNKPTSTFNWYKPLNVSETQADNEVEDSEQEATPPPRRCPLRLGLSRRSKPKYNLHRLP